MCMQVERAIEFYQKARQASEAGQAVLAEVYYLQSMGCFKKAGGKYHLNAANALSALAYLRKLHGDYAGALSSAKQALQIMDEYNVSSADADVIRHTTWELIEQINLEVLNWI